MSSSRAHAAHAHADAAEAHANAGEFERLISDEGHGERDNGHNGEDMENRDELEGSEQATGTGRPSLSTKEALVLVCGRLRWWFLTLGLAVGTSLLLQGVLQQCLVNVGLSAAQSGLANALYQSSAAVVGVSIGLRVTSPTGTVRVLNVLHCITVLSALSLVFFAAVGGTTGLLLACVGLGIALMGMLPFALHHLVLMVQKHGAVTERVVAGFRTLLFEIV